MFGVEANPETVFHVFHDESGTYVPNAGDRWLLHSVLLVRASRQADVFAALQEVRKRTEYFGEIHYSDFRKSAGGHKCRCATGWLDVYARQLSDFCYYHCLAVDTRSPGFQPNRFGKPHHVYNYFARVAVVGSIAWSLKPYQRVALKFYSDAKFRQEGDNFATYLPCEVYNQIKEKRQQNRGEYPEIRLVQPEVVPIVSDPDGVRPELRQECEIIQLVDLVTGSIGQALTDRSEQRAKIALAEILAHWIEDTRKPPWLQTEDLHRRFSVSCFPDSRGEFYNLPLAIMSRDQLPLPLLESL